LPFAADVPAGTEIKFSDEAAVATPTNTVSIARASAPDTINGAIGQQVVLGKGVRQKSSVRSDGVSNWILSSLFGPLDGSTVGATTPSTGAFTTIAGTSASANALAVGRQGTTDPGLNVNASVASCVTGVNISSRAAGGSVFVSAISSASNEALAIDSKGSSTLFLGGNSSGGVSIAGGGGTTIVNGPLTLNATPFVVPGQCRLIRVGSTQVRLTPFNGNMIKINGDMYPIPAAGINLASGTFSAATFYYIYAFQTAGVVSLENSTTGHVTDTTAGNVGVEIKSGDATRTLVGAAQLNGGGVFEDSDTNRLVISWFNRQLKRVENTFSTVRTTASTTAVELHAEIRCNFLCWVDDALRISANGSTFNSAAGTNNTGIGIDGLTVDGVTSAQATTYIPLGLNESRTFLTENVAHYATLVGYVSASTGSWVGANVNCKLSGSILG
jgi:hypothetical protein